MTKLGLWIEKKCSEKLDAMQIGTDIDGMPMFRHKLAAECLIKLWWFSCRYMIDWDTLENV